MHGRLRKRTCDQTLHLIFPNNLDPECFCDLVVVLVGAAPCRHDADIAGGCAIVSVVRDQVAHEVDACVYPVGFELEKVQPATERVVAMFAGEVHELGQGAPNLRA